MAVAGPPEIKALLSDAADEILACYRLIRLLAQAWEPGSTDGEIEAFEPMILREPIAPDLRDVLAVVVPETFGREAAS